MIKIDERQLDEINKNFAKLGKLASEDAVKKLADGVGERAYGYADEHTDTGEMIRSMFYKQTGKSAYEIGFDTAKAPHALFVHFGTKAHTIKPLERKALRWVNGGKFIFAKNVNHPGYKGDEFLYRALDDELKEFSRWLDAEVEKLV